MDDPQTSAPGYKLNWLTKLLIYLGGGDPETAARCPKAERGHLVQLGLIPLFVFLYQAGIYGVTAHYLFAAPGRFRPDLALIGIFLAAFFLIQDIYSFNRAGVYAAGAFELGLLVPGARAVKAATFAIVRLAQAVGMSQLCAVFCMLILFDHDISVPIKNEWLKADRTPIAAATLLVDAEIGRQTGLVNKQIEVVTNLSGQVTALQQKEVDPSAGDPELQQAEAELKALLDQKVAADAAVTATEKFAANELGGIQGSPSNSGKPGRGFRRIAALEQVKNARDRAQSLDTAINPARSRVDALRKQLDAASAGAKADAHDQLPGYTNSLAEARNKLNALETHLHELVNGREASIEAAVENSPDYVPYDDGLLHRIVVLEQIINSDPKIFLMALLIDLTALGLELAGVLAKLTVYIPSSYNALVVRDTHLRIDELADSLRRRLDDPDTGSTPPPEPLDPDKPIIPGNPFGPVPNYPPANDNAELGVVANDNHSGDSQGTTGTDDLPMPAPPAPKRKRGRPRKNPPPAPLTGPNGQAK